MPDTVTPERRLDFEAKFTQWNLNFEFIHDFSLTQDLRVLDEAQVRDLSNISPTTRLQQYYEQMRHGTTFPPIVVAAELFNETDVLIDGNTRARAAQRLKRATFPAYRVSPIPDADFARMLGAALNQMGGQRLESREANQIALVYMERGWGDETIAREIGYHPESVRRWRRETEFVERVERLELEQPAGKLTKKQRQSVAKVTHDAPFAEVVKFVADTALGEADLKELITAVEQANSDEDALAAVEQMRQDAIGPPPNKPYRNPVARQAKMHIGGLLKVDPVKVYDPISADADYEKWRQLRDVIEQVLAVFEQHRSSEAA
jgi:hypothetical protein